MQFAEIIRNYASNRILACLCFTAFLISTPESCSGQQKTEHDTVNRLISMVEKVEIGDSGQSGPAQKLFASIAADSYGKPVAALALTLIHIRERQFSDAWKVLTAANKDQTSSSDTVKFTKERLKLWLLLEADAAEKAEAQFTKIVNLSLDATSGDPDLAANCGFIGSVAGMLQTDQDAPCIPGPTASRAIEQLLLKLESTTAKTKLKEQLAENSQWGQELVASVNKFESLGQAEAEQLASSTHADLEVVDKELLQLRGDMKEAGGEKHVLEDQRRRWFQNRKAILQEMARETPGKPQYPVEPGPAPRRPIQPMGHYKVDPKTLAAKYVPPDACEESRYERNLREYDNQSQKWRVRLANYQRDILEYPAKIKLWEQQDATRRASLNDQKRNADMGIASTESAMKSMQDDIKQGVAKDLKETVEQQKNLTRLVAMSNVAVRYTTNKDLKPKRFIRPSSFPLLDYEGECNRLKKSLRELQGPKPGSETQLATDRR